MKSTSKCIVIVGSIVLVWAITPFVIRACSGWNNGWEKAGPLGDTFGAVNALFTALSMAALVVALVYQAKSLRLQERALREQIKELKLSTKALEISNSEFRAQKEEMKGQRLELEATRKQREDHARMDTYRHLMNQIEVALNAVEWNQAKAEEALFYIADCIKRRSLRKGAGTVDEQTTKVSVVSLYPVLTTLIYRLSYAAQYAGKISDESLRNNMVDYARNFIPIGLNPLMSEIKKLAMDNGKIITMIERYDSMPEWARVTV